MRINKLLFLIIFICTLVLLKVTLYDEFDAYLNSNEALDKTEWSVLQNVEYKHRSDLDKSKLLIERITENETLYLVLGVPVKKENSYTWILLNSQNNQLIKQIPKINHYSISKDDFEKVRSLKSISPIVLDELARRIN